VSGVEFALGYQTQNDTETLSQQVPLEVETRTC